VALASEENLPMRARIAIVVAAAVALGASAAKAAEPKVGDKAPDFTLKASDGNTYKLSDFQGKQPVVIAWFPKAFTGGCTKECKSFAANSQALKGTKAAYFTASTDDVETNTKFADSLSADYPILSDPTKETAKAYGVVHEGRQVPERWTFYIDKDGVIREIDKGVQSRTESAGQDVVAKLKDLGLAS
jgi:peroxiredoxin Q/BCP